jgi:hypothetical protein
MSPTRRQQISFEWHFMKTIHVVDHADPTRADLGYPRVPSPTGFKWGSAQACRSISAVTDREARLRFVTLRTIETHRGAFPSPSIATLQNKAQNSDVPICRRN